MAQHCDGLKNEWDEELLRLERFGITDLPDPLPHPDQVKIDMNTGKAWVEGPMTKDEKAQLEGWVRKRDGFKEDLEFVHGELEIVEDDEYRAFLEADFARTQKMVDVIQKVLNANGYEDPD